jgi:hypothetical protein
VSEQRENLERVSERISQHILAFAKLRLEAGAPDFRMEDLVEYVRTKVPVVAPDSASRILRDLRQQGVLGYVVVSRSGSHYRLLADHERPGVRLRRRGRPPGATKRKRNAAAFWHSLTAADQTAVTDLLLGEIRKLPFGAPEATKFVAARELLIAHAEGSYGKQLPLNLKDEGKHDG